MNPEQASEILKKVRTIDWDVTARTGHAFMKKFIEERELTIMFQNRARRMQSS